jgi:hypothetical protein
MEKINRRKAMALMAKWSAISCIPFSWVLESCQQSGPSSLLSTDYQVLLSTLVDIILPKTPESPGAKEANVQHFVAIIIEDCYEDEDRNRIVIGLNALLSEGFLNKSGQEQFDILNRLDQDALNDPSHYFKDLKSLTQWGYFSSELGITKGLRYNPIPGSYKGCEPYNGEVAWY